MAGRLWGTQWGPGQDRTQFAGADEALKALDRKAKRLGRPLSVFHNSLSDFFDNEVPTQWRISALRSMLETRNLIHLLLTKRIGNAAAMLEKSFRAVHAQREGWAENFPSNIWIGATIVSQDEAERDIPKLSAVPAAKRFVSMEPLLGPVDLQLPLQITRDAKGWVRLERFDSSDGGRAAGVGTPQYIGPSVPDVDWVIVGGESGSGARPMDPDWARSLRDQCEAAGVPFMMKQMGGVRDKRGSLEDLPDDLRIREFA